MAAEHQDQRWLQIQPGIAIDSYGNPIVVPQAIAFRLSSTAPESGSATIYITVRYVDPERLQGQGDRDLVQETFRIDETSGLPSGVEVELCRVLLQPGEVKLRAAADVLHPAANQLDLRYRQQAQARPVQHVCVAPVLTEQSDNPLAANANQLRSLTQSLAALYPAMQGSVMEPINLAALSSDFPADLMYFTYSQLIGLSGREKEALQQYFATGTVALVEVSVEEAGIAELSLVKQQLQGAIANLAGAPETTAIQWDLEVELTAIEVALNKQIQAIATSVQTIGQQMGMLTETSGALDREHPLRLSPFLFAQLPIVKDHPIHIFNWGSIVLIIGSLSYAWGLDDALSLSRETIRTAQEMGINLLHFSWRRRQLTQLQQAT